MSGTVIAFELIELDLDKLPGLNVFETKPAT